MATIQLFINNELILQLHPKKSNNLIYEPSKMRNQIYHLRLIYVYLGVIWYQKIIQDSIKKSTI